MPNESPGAARSRRRAILLVLGSAGSFTLAAALVKVAAPEVPTVELMFFRSLVGVVFLAPWVVRAGGWAALRPRRPWGHLVRAGSGMLGMFGPFYGYAHMPLAAVTALGFAMPLVLAGLSVPLLGERLTRARGLSIGAGLLGVVLVIRPWEGAAGLPLFATGVVLAGVVGWAVSMATIRLMGQAGERNVTIIAVFSICCAVMSGALTVPVWVTPRPGLWIVLIGIGVVSGGAQFLMTEGYRSGEASMLAPFEYSAIFYTVLLGWVVWGEVPGPGEVMGISVLVASGLFAWWREGRG